MKQSTQWTLYVLLIPFTALVFYGIFNAGKPGSLFRLVTPDPAYDLTVTLVCGVIVAVIAVALFAGRNESPLRKILELNAEHIGNLRRQGLNEDQIAESFLHEIGSRQGPMYWIVKRRIVHHLARIETRHEGGPA